MMTKRKQELYSCGATELRRRKQFLFMNSKGSGQVLYVVVAHQQ